MVMVEFSRGAPDKRGQQQSCEQARSFCRALEDHLSWIIDHGSETLMLDYPRSVVTPERHVNPLFRCLKREFVRNFEANYK